MDNSIAARQQMVWLLLGLFLIPLIVAVLLVLTRPWPALHQRLRGIAVAVRHHLRQFWYSDCFTVRVIFGAIAVASGIFVMLPFATSTPPFTILAQNVSEAVWGALMCLVGVLQIVSAYRKDVGHLGEVAAGSGVLGWGFLFLVSLGSQANAIVVLLYAAFSLVWVWIFFKMPGNLICDALDCGQSVMANVIHANSNASH